MTLLIVLITLALVQIWGSGAPLHRDGWFLRWGQYLEQVPRVSGNSGFLLGVTILLPVLMSAVVMVIAEGAVGGLGYLLIGVPLLLYCLGRGNFNDTLANYLRNWYRGDLEGAAKAVSPILCEIHEAPSDSLRLHEQVFRGAAYCAFERLFAVLFWFILLGIPGAVLFRLSALYAEHTQGTSGEAAATRWLWLLEWLPVRMMGLSFAIVGNFAGCYRAWRQVLMCRERDTGQILEAYLEGALGGIDANECSAGTDVSQIQRQGGAEIEGLQGLLSRTLLLWITGLALLALFT
ncbi:regulatory signaling modulator protein AmpE [Microbulbifer sp. OS29]|uniref:Regulatory signaling modulator protein AmpE n=1 Tax=Microbulbifer okhotskensis TaxID=2926617 RepID=A0A9X2J782_9GAMM|nr:regulatory signaling modulator protein AmpE [Microbulbifer okhotskensis]MCO1334186.1 regulatory signaling modulator protein AmpE [Microbulbifer okhotskensis]